MTLLSLFFFFFYLWYFFFINAAVLVLTIIQSFPFISPVVEAKGHKMLAVNHEYVQVRLCHRLCTMLTFLQKLSYQLHMTCL